MFATARYIILITAGFCCAVSAMDDRSVRESFMRTMDDSVQEITRFVEAYEAQIDHKTFCRALHKALIRGDLSLVQFLIKKGNIDVVDEVFSAEYETGNKPLTALEIVDLKYSQADNWEDREWYQDVKRYVQNLICSDARCADDDVVALKPNRTCKNTGCVLLAGSLLCWYVYTIMMRVFSGTVTRN